ncbi:MAG: ribonuclease HII [Verrucomicrobiota bacterium]
MQQPALERKRSSNKPTLPVDQFEFERQLLQRGRKAIAGVDEAGRGPLAGPVVAAAVILPNDWIASGMPVELAALNDSKQLTYRQREEFYGRLIGSASVRFAVATVDVETIDFLNILEATYRAMKQALRELSPPPDHVLVDGWRVSSLRLPQTALVKGDARSFSIAAASVLAKVTRDRLMLDYDRRYPDYEFAKHKGYGTAGHLAAIAKHGICPIHRRSFAPVRGQLNSNSPELFQI